MTTTRSIAHHGSRRRTPLRVAALGAIVALASPLVACGSTASEAAPINQPSRPPVVQVEKDAGHHMNMPDGSRTPSESALYQAIQNLWQQHMEWTYAAIAAFAVDSPTFPATADRLLQNQVDIGKALEPVYGKDAAGKLTALLQDHIKGVVAILTAAKAGDSVAQNQAVADEYGNAKAIGDFLAEANPSHWEQADMEAMMKTHIDQTLVYATDLLTGGYAQAITHYGEAEAHMVEMGDMLAAGMIAQFPDLFTK
ncbi:MAG: hypothetical protein ABIP03_00905 [Aquihabitans sp.]